MQPLPSKQPGQGLFFNIVPISLVMQGHFEEAIFFFLLH